jgi:peptidoglycan/LPS O-acetylase OafA/YrhL
MKNVDEVYVGLGLVWLLGGVLLGSWLGATGHFEYTNTHAHVNSVGFAISVLFGLVYRAYPEMRASRIAWPQLALYQAGAILLLAGKAVVDGGGSDSLVKIGAVVVTLGVVAMLVVFFTRRARQAEGGLAPTIG